MPRKAKRSSVTKLVDAWCAKCIKEAANWTCERCGLVATDDTRQKFHCAHNIGRRHYAVRWDPRNAWCLCAECHLAVDTCAYKKAQLINKTIGGGIAELLAEKARFVPRYRDIDKREAVQHFKDEYQRLRELREKGSIERFMVQIWD